MNNKILYAVIVVLIAIVAGGGTYFFLNRQGVRTETSVLPVASDKTPSGSGVSGQTAPTNGSLSEQPNKAKFNEYLTDIYLGKMAIGKKIGTDGFPIQTGIFTRGVDQLCTMMTAKKTLASGNIAIAVYNAVSKQDDQPRIVTPMGLEIGGNGGCSSLTQSAGKYEYKFYIENILVAVLPFEVK